VQLLQEDASLTARELADHVGLTPTPCWRRVQNLEAAGVITKRVALVDPAKVNLDVTALVQIRTNDHGAGWLKDFKAAIDQFPEVVEAYRTSGEIDYMLRVVVPSIDTYDQFYKRLIEAVDLYDVRTIFVMERMKQTTAHRLGQRPALLARSVLGQMIESTHRIGQRRDLPSWNPPQRIDGRIRFLEPLAATSKVTGVAALVHEVL